MQVALQLLATREHARAELQRKLAAKGCAAEYIDEVLDQLAAQNLQSDERFTEHYVAQRIRQGYGPLRIVAELRERGITEDLIADRVVTNDPEWRQHMEAVVSSRFGELAASDRRELTKRARFLEYRGFSADLIRRYLFD